MNTDIRHILRLCMAVIVACSLLSCSDDDTVTPPSQQQNALRFSLNGVETRLNYDFEQTYFTDGDVIGCVIAEVKEDGTYGYLRNSAWKYREKDGMLIFQYYWGYKIIHETWGDTSGYGKVFSEDTEIEGESGTTPISAKILMQEKYRDENSSNLDESFLYSPYLNEESNRRLAFFFYYPYVDKELLDIATSNVSDYKSIVYPNSVQEGETLPGNYSDWSQKIMSGEVSDSPSSAGWDNYAKYGWTEYPCFVNHTQGNLRTEGGLNDVRLQNSDFLWVASPDITATTMHTVNLTFQKKMATILVYSEEKLDDIYFMPSGDKALIRGKQIDLSNGELKDYTDPVNSRDPATVQQKNKYFNVNEKIVPCYRGDDKEQGVDYYFYRVVLPAQENCRFKMHIRFTPTDGGTEIDKDINLSDDDGLTSLKEGYIYSIRISRSGTTVIRINDWQNGGWTELEPGTDARQAR